MPVNPNPHQKKNTLAGLAVPSSIKDPQLRRYLQAVKQHIELQHGNKGQPKERFATLADLEKIGLVTIREVGGRGEIVKTSATSPLSSGSKPNVLVQSTDTVFPYTDPPSATQGNAAIFDGASNSYKAAALLDGNGNIITSKLPTYWARLDVDNYYLGGAEYAVGAELTMASDSHVRWRDSNHNKPLCLINLAPNVGDAYRDVRRGQTTFNGGEGHVIENDSAEYSFGPAYGDAFITRLAGHLYGNACAEFGGTNGYWEFPANDLNSPGADDFTFEFNLKFTALPNAAVQEMCIWSAWDTTANERCFAITVDTSNQLNFYWSVDGTAVKSVVTAPLALATNTWNWYAIQRSGGTMSVWVDGTAVSVAGDSIAGDTIVETNVPLLYYGAIEDATDQLFLNGHIDETRMTKVARYDPDATTIPVQTVTWGSLVITATQDELELGDMYHNVRVSSPTMYTEQIRPYGVFGLVEANDGVATIGGPFPNNANAFGIVDATNGSTSTVLVNTSGFAGGFFTGFSRSDGLGAPGTNSIVVQPGGFINSGVNTSNSGDVTGLIGGGSFANIGYAGSATIRDFDFSVAGFMSIGGNVSLGSAGGATFTQTGGASFMSVGFNQTLATAGNMNCIQSQPGSFMTGWQGGNNDYLCSGFGSSIFGVTDGTDGTIITASGRASVCIHYGTTGSICTASGNEAVQIGAGVNSVNTSLRVGDGVHLRGDGTVNCLLDNLGVVMGAGADASIYFDGTDLVLDAASTVIEGEIGLNGATPVVQSTGWSTSNVASTKTFDANATSLDEIADVLGTLIDYLLTRGDIAA